MGYSVQIKIWDYWSKHYHNLWVQKLSLEPTRKAVSEEILNIVNPAKKLSILDVGCGTGQLLSDLNQQMNQYYVRFTGIDLSEKMLQRAPTSNRIEYIHSNINDFKLTKKYDIIVCTHSFPYFKDKDKIINNFYNALVPGGTLLMANASMSNIYDKILLFFVKFTAGPAHYPSVKQIKRFVSKQKFILSVRKIKTANIVPTIYLVKCRKPR